MAKNTKYEMMRTIPCAIFNLSLFIAANIRKKISDMISRKLVTKIGPDSHR